MLDLASVIRNVPDFPKPGIQFKDITSLLQDPVALRETMDQLAAPYRDKGIAKVVAVESRGFIFGAALAAEIGAGFVPIRKPGKLPSETLRQEYELEYGTDAIEIHKDAIAPGESVLVLDDLLATGGTLEAACQLVEQLGGRIWEVVAVIELVGLNGRSRLGAYPFRALVQLEVDE